ncbi:MAG: efflux RND transporter periplasmic adaptor subunit, partial [Saprospiraceae bacterium]|nr:efflux RND transporter periplasmic adaptor subunit [Saprospiraceae bacterium]
MNRKNLNAAQKVNLHFLFIPLLLSLLSCSSKNKTMGMEELSIPVTADDRLVDLSEYQFAASEMMLGKIELNAFQDIVKANGVIDLPPESQAAVSSYFGGTVSQIKLLRGSEVKKGQVLFTLENPEYIQMQQDYLEAKGQLEYLQSDYERQSNLIQDNITSQKNYLKAKSDFTVNKIKVQSLAKKLKMMGITPDGLTLDSIRSTIDIRSPISGFVSEVNITLGTYLRPSEIAVKVVNTDHLHLELNIFEKDLQKVKVGQPIHFKLQQDEDKEYRASVHLLNKSIDLEDRTIGIHGHFTDREASGQFSPGMYVEAEIETSSEMKPSLPEEAVVDIDGKYFVLVFSNISHGDYSFEEKLVQIGATHNGYVEILNSEEFDQNSQFLVKGAFNLIK